MEALILAAGFGTRLKPLTDTIPKALIPVNGQPIIFKQISNLYENGIENITVVTGYKSHILEAALSEHYPNVGIVHSEQYQITNNMYSAYLAREKFSNKPFLMLNADVFLDSSVITSLMTMEAENAIVTDIGRYMDESMKVTEKNGILISISKSISSKESLGCSIDVYKFSKEASSAFFDICINYIEEKREVKLWSEVAINDLLQIIPFKACPLNGRWFEIDSYEDLKQAEILFSEISTL